MGQGPVPVAAAVDDFVSATIQQFRAKLLDLSSRNPLVNFRHSERSRSHIRIVDEIPELLFDKLEGAKQLWFEPLPDPEGTPADEELPFFQQALEQARKSDLEYQEAITAAGPSPSPRRLQKIERELRNRVRVDLGLTPFEQTADPKKWAAQYGISAEYDLPKVNGENRRKHTDNRIQTLFFREDLDRKLSRLQESARSLMQDAGLAALYCAFGFLEYYESDDSDEKRVAPLLFYPVEISRELQNGEYRYFVTGKNEDAQVNVALRELLKRDHSINLPDWTNQGDENQAVGDYLARVEAVISGRRDWNVRRYLTIGLFTFSTLVMYQDLDPAKWPQEAPLNKKPLLRTLIAGAEMHGSTIATDYAIDEITEPDALLITDADSSQHSAVIDVLKGKNTVIQGPPGTGKSQTITNIISAALNVGKTVLFVAEKMAALEVVKKRLDAAELGPFCLELHSSKTSKTAVVQSLSERLEFRGAAPRPVSVQSNLEAVAKAKAELLYYVQKTNEQAGTTGLTVRDVLLGSAVRECDRSAFPDELETARFGNALGLTPHMRKEMFDAAANLERQTAVVTSSTPLHKNPWRGFQNSELTDLEVRGLLERFHKAVESLREFVGRAQTTYELVNSTCEKTIEAAKSFVDAVTSLPEPSSGMDPSLLRRLETSSGRDHLRAAIEAVEQVRNARTRLSQHVTQPATAEALGSELAHQLAVKSAAVLPTETIASLIQEISVRSARSTAIAKLAPVGEKLRLSCHGDAADLRSLRACSVGVKSASELPAEFHAIKCPEHVDEANQQMIAKTADSLAVLRKKRLELTQNWDDTVFPASDEIRRYVFGLRSANWLKAIWDKDCRAARRLSKLAFRGANKLDRETLASQLSQWVQLLENEARFKTDLSIRKAFGTAFDGLNTDADSCLKISRWADQVRKALAPFGDLGIRLAGAVVTESTPQLRYLASLDGDTALNELRALLSEPHADDTTVEAIASSLTNSVRELQSIVDAANAMAINRELPLGECGAVASVLSVIEKNLRLFVTNAAPIGISDFPLDNQALANWAHTLDFADSIAQSSLDEGARGRIFEDLNILSILRVRTAELNGCIQKAIAAINEASDAAKLDWSSWLPNGNVENLDVEAVSARFTRALDNADQLQDYIGFLLAEDLASDSGLGPVLGAYTKAGRDYIGLTQAAEFVFYRSAAEQVLNADPRLRRHSGSSHELLRNQYRALDKEYLSLRRQLLGHRLLQRPAPYGVYQGRVADLTELALVQHIAKQVRPRIPLRELFRRAGNAISAVKPCWMMSPMSVAQFLEPGGVQFDLVVMDEASQIRPEEALGAIARGAQVVVVGDQMQLPPTSFFQRLSTDGTSDEYDEEDVQQESVLESAASRFFPPRMLRWHYRSEHGSLISFSNQEFYRSELTVFPSPRHEHEDYGVKLVQADGTYSAGTNECEARHVIDCAAEFMKTHPDQSLGIVAVNSKQAEMLREMLDALAAAEPEVEAYREKWAATLESLFVKNLENVQGDERDVIFISTVYGPDANGTFYQRFGPINSVYGHRRLNVLFTRAKKKLVVFTSMRPADIVDEGKSWGVRALKGYLQYARTGNPILPTGSQGPTDSEFEQWVLQSLSANGYEAVPQLGFAGYRIDLAVKHPRNPGTFMCGIECDGATYHSARSVRERDRLRQEILEKLGWNIYRIWSTDWFRNPALQTKNLLKHLAAVAAD